CQQHNGYPWTF
nr:immunoglobulin light chain junction region [Macaca mulatta]MOV61139.1 immunoglobulin light chain junction region [Macaca mulatta]MOV61439.1 immunoglobulin light chain junction region [Macaca mulatta]MOV61855.1 immunoglobulin light chain junction region [Macaca mulatta]MOV61999.1 immunoglobulin light chain junction region [Macaca mulatta]